jgi:hypothetical protein
MPYQETELPAALRNKPRTQNEGNVLYSLLNSYRLGRVEVSAPGVCTWTADADESIPAGNNNYYLFATSVFNMGGSDLNLIISGNKGGSGLVNGYVTVDGNAIYDDTFIVSGADNWNSISGVTCTGGIANDLVDIWAIPDIDQFTELAYVRSWETPRGDHIIPVPDKFDPQAATVRVRRNPSFSISKDYVDPNALDIVRGRECTIIIEIHPDGLSVVQEYIIMPKAAVSSDVTAPDTAMLQAVAEGSARGILSYSPSG